MSKIKILVTSDIHGYIYPYDYASNDEKNMGLAKIAGLISELRDENTIVIDNGDSFEGSPLSFYHYHYQKDKLSPITKAFKLINYDYINIGNHDFNYGKDELFKHLNMLSAKCITCNIEPLPYSYDIKEINGKKLGIFGIVTHYIPNWEKENHIEGLNFLDAFKTAEKIVKEIRNQVDYVICVYHGGFEKDLVTFEPTEALTGENQGSKMLEEIEGIDILITGHQHRSISDKVKNVVVTQTLNNGFELACIEIDDEIESRLLKPESIDFKMLEIIRQEEEACQKWLDTVIGTCVNDLRVLDENDARLNKHQVITFLNNVARYYSGSDLSANALFINAKGFKKEITVRDLVSTYVYPNTLFVKKIDGKNLKLYLEKCAEYFSVANDEIVVNEKYIYPKVQHYNYDMVDGIDYVIKAGNPVGEKIISLKYNGKDVKENDQFTLAVNNYRASGGGDFDMIKSLETVKEINKGMVELLIEYIDKFKVINFEEVHNIKVIK